MVVLVVLVVSTPSTPAAVALAYCHFKHFLEAPPKDCFDLIQVNRASQQIAQGSDGTIQDSTGVNELEVTQIGIDV